MIFPYSSCMLRLTFLNETFAFEKLFCSVLYTGMRKGWTKKQEIVEKSWTGAENEQNM